jgi:hypothetical protein
MQQRADSTFFGIVDKLLWSIAAFATLSDDGVDTVMATR